MVLFKNILSYRLMHNELVKGKLLEILAEFTSLPLATVVVPPGRGWK